MQFGSPDPQQNIIQQRQQEMLRQTQRDSRDAIYQQRIDTTPYEYKRSGISNVLGVAGDIVGQNVNPLAGQALKMLGDNPDVLASAANTAGNLLGGENTAIGRALHGFVNQYNDDQVAARDRALEAYTRKIVGAYLTDNRNANPDKIKWRIIRNIKKGRNPYYKVTGRIRPELVNMSEVNFSFQKQLKKALESGNTQMVAYLLGRHTARSNTDNKGNFLDRNDQKIKQGKAAVDKAFLNYQKTADPNDFNHMVQQSMGTRKYNPKKEKRAWSKGFDDVTDERSQNAQTSQKTASPKKQQPTLKDIGRRLKRGFITGVNTGSKRDYAYNVGTRVLNGYALGTGTGALVGKAIETSKIKKAIRESNEKHSKGVVNKVLNTIDKNRLQRHADIARKFVKDKHYTSTGATYGGLLGEVLGAGEGLAETAIRHHLAKKKKTQP